MAKEGQPPSRRIADELRSRINRGELEPGTKLPSERELAQLYFADGRDAQGEKVLRDLMSSPTVFVSKEQATITLARYLMPKKPAESRKLLDTLRSKPGAAGQVALSMIGELPPQ